MRHSLAACAPLLLALATMGAAPAAILPDTQAGRRAQAYFDAFNTGSEDAMRAFLSANVSERSLAERPVDVRLGAYRQMRDQHGTLHPVRLLDQSEDQVHVLARDRFDHTVDLTFQFDAAAPHTLRGVRVLENGPGGGPPEELAEPLTEEQAVAAWRAQLDSLARADRFSGAALLAKGGQVRFESAYGEASRPDHRPNRVDTKFNLGSINKIFTKLAIAQLVEQGKVRLDDTIDRYLPDYPKAVASKVTVRQLLEHRGGIGDIFGDAYDRMDRSKLRRVSDWIPLFRDVPLAFEPGTREQYSNGGYVLLGAIVERASGEDYYDYVRRHIYRPLGMNDTDHYPSDGKTPNLAAGYTRQITPGAADRGGWTDNAATRPWRGSPAGGGYSTLADLLRFVEAMRAGRLLKPETLARDFPEWQAGPQGEVGLGIGGGAPGINASIETVGPYTVIVLANLDPPAATEPARWLSRRLPASGPHQVRRVLGAGGGTGTGSGPDARARGIDAPPKATLPPEGVVVEMLEADHLPAVRVKVNGQGPFLFGIDTGARGAARIDSVLAARLGLEVIGQVRGGDPSGQHTRTMSLVRVDSLEIGGARFEGVAAAVRDYNERRIGARIDGIIGFGLFQELLLTLDYPGSKVRIERGTLPPADGAEVIPIRLERGIPSIDVEVDSLEVEADVDAGSMGGFSLPERLIERLPLASKPQVVGHARTISSEFDVKAARLEGHLKIGGLQFTNPTLEFQPVFEMGNVGSRVLRDFVVTFDQANRRMRWRKPG